jgi:hypothetical protein
MRKLKLDPEALSVQSFSVDPPRNERGTVQGHASTGCTPASACETLFTCYYTCDGGSCDGALSCGPMATCTDCGETCGETCLDTCG